MLRNVTGLPGACVFRLPVVVGCRQSLLFQPFCLTGMVRSQIPSISNIPRSLLAVGASSVGDEESQY